MFLFLFFLYYQYRFVTLFLTLNPIGNVAPLDLKSPNVSAKISIFLQKTFKKTTYYNNK